MAVLALLRPSFRVAPRALASRIATRSNSTMEHHPAKLDPNLISKIQHFLSSSNFAVVANFKDFKPAQPKPNYRIVEWYIRHQPEKGVTAVHIDKNNNAAVLPEGKSLLPTVESIDKLPSNTANQNARSLEDTSVSIVINAKETIKILRQAKEMNARAIWIQPGAMGEFAADADTAGARQQIDEFISTSGMADRMIWGGPCIMVEGSEVLKKHGQGQAKF